MPESPSIWGHQRASRWWLIGRSEDRTGCKIVRDEGAEGARCGVRCQLACLLLRGASRCKSRAELADDLRPAVQHRQDLVGLGWRQPDVHSGDAEVAVAL